MLRRKNRLNRLLLGTGSFGILLDHNTERVWLLSLKTKCEIGRCLWGRQPFGKRLDVMIWKSTTFEVLRCRLCETSKDRKEIKKFDFLWSGFLGSARSFEVFEFWSFSAFFQTHKRNFNFRLAFRLSFVLRCWLGNFKNWNFQQLNRNY